MVNVVIVHGAFADGSGWRGVYDILKKNGMHASIVQNPLTSFEDDVAATRRVLAAHEGPVVLVGHSYGGAVITEAGNDPKVAALVYVAAFMPDAGESIKSIKDAAPKSDIPSPVLPSTDGFLMIDRTKFAASFAADVDPEQAAFMADSQGAWNTKAVGGVITEPAWKSKPSWYILATEDKMVPPELQRQMAERARAQIVEIAGSHALFIASPESVAQVIQTAAQSILATV